MPDSTEPMVALRASRERGAPADTAIVPMGEMGGAEMVRVADAVARAVSDGRAIIAIDLQWVTTLDAIGLAFLKRVRRRLEARGGRLLLRGATPDVAHLLDICGIEHRRWSVPLTVAGSSRRRTSVGAAISDPPAA